MQAMARGLLVGGVAALAAVVVACTALVDTNGLTDGSPGSAPDAAVSPAGTVGDSGADGGALADGAASDAAGPIDDGPCTIPFVQAVPGTGTYQVIQQSASLSQSIPVTAGNLLVAIAYGGQSPGNSTPHTTDPNMEFVVADSQGNTYYAGAMFENGTTNQSAIQIFYAPNVKGGLTHVTATTTTPSGIVPWTGLFLQEYAGVATTDVVDVASGQSAPAPSTATSPSAMTTRRCSVVVGAFVDGHVVGQSVKAGTGWVFRSTDEWDPGGAVDNAPSGARAGTSVDARIDLTLAPDNGWVAAQMAFRAATTAPLPQPTQVALRAPASLGAGTCSGAVTLETRNAASVATITSTGVRAVLSGTGLTYYADPACVYPINSALVGAGASSMTFYVKAANGGTRTITVTPANGFGTVSQGIAVSG
jgi:hypothetical protein